MSLYLYAQLVHTMSRIGVVLTVIYNEERRKKILKIKKFRVVYLL